MSKRQVRKNARTPLEVLNDIPVAGKLLILVLIPLGITFSVTLLLFINGLNQLESDTSTARLVQEERVISQEFVQLQSQLSSEAARLATDSALLEAAQRGDQDTIAGLLLRATIQTPHLSHAQIVDGTGQTLGIKGKFEAQGRPPELERLNKLGLLRAETTELVWTDQGWLLTVVQPLTPPTGQVAGVLTLGTLLNEPTLYELNLGRSDPRVVLFDAEGNSSAISQHHLKGTADAADAECQACHQDAAALSNLQGTLVSAAHFAADNTLWKQAQSGQVALGQVQLQDAALRAAYAPLQIGDQSPAVFGVLLSTKATADLRNQLLLTSLAVGLLVVVLAALSAVTFGRRSIAQPLVRVATGAQQIIGGQLDVVISGADRQDEIGTLAATFNDMTAQLSQTLGSLQNRNRDLILAAEISRSVSHVQEPGEMLMNAVEFIRTLFDLYYTQVYLVDPSGRTLVLRAGTGTAGAELRRRNHRLPISPTSINGRAAAERRAIIVSDTASSIIHRPNPLLPDTQSEMAVPLIAAQRVVGVLDLQSAQPGALTEDNLPIFEAIASQLAIAVENAALFAEVEQARTEVEAQARRLTQAGWREFLDAVNRSERLGYAFDQHTLKPLAEPALASADPTAVDMPIMVTGEPIGRIRLERDAEIDQAWDPADAELVGAIASRVATQVENLRLLAQAEQYRAEAEAAMRRLTREGWQALQTRGDLAPGYVYDLTEVKRLSQTSDGISEGVLKHPIVVGNEPIGELAVDIAADDAETAELIAAVADRLSGHLESLRLSEQNEKRAHEMETVAEVSATTATLLDPDRLLYAVVDLTKERFGLYHAHIYLVDSAWQALLLAAGAGEVGRKMVAKEHGILLDAEKSLVARAARDRQAVIVNDVRSEPDFLPNPLLPETRSEMAVPMIVGDKVLGVFDVQSAKHNGFSQEDASLYSTLAAQVGVALQNARLYVEQASTVTQLRELDRLKSSFLANMSHELRTPLNSILGFSDVMLDGLDGPLTETMESDLKLINRNGQHLLSLINDVLDMAKIESGKMNLNFERFNVHEVLTDVVNITASLARDKALSLQLATEPSPDLVVEADHIRLRQVMINLVGNAIKFTEAGGATISAVRQDGCIRINVHDTGIGVLPEQAQMIFEEFGQVDTSTTRKTGGTGLGLPISRKLIELHGGRLWVESTGVRGEGSTFIIELPVTRETRHD
jgi:signal transduction histidine kinase/HAMP domain-containing protein